MASDKGFAVLDTSFLLDVVKRKIDLTGEFRNLLPGVGLCCVEETLFELDKLAGEGAGDRAKLAKLTRQIVDSAKLTVVTREPLLSTADEKIIDLVEGKFNMQYNIQYVATQDMGLRTLLKNSGKKIIMLRRTGQFAIVIG